MSTAVFESLYQEELYLFNPSVIVILPKPWHNVLEEEKALLSKILGSVKISLEAVSIIVQENVSIDALSALKPSKVLVFGASIDIKSYELIIISNNIHIIKTDELAKLDDAKKKSLWLALKQMFAV